MSSTRKQRAEVVRLIVTTRERFPHTPAIMRAMRRVIWRYVADAEATTSRSTPASAKKKKPRTKRVVSRPTRPAK